MIFVRPTTAISRADLVQSCLQELRMRPGCESVGMICASCAIIELDIGAAGVAVA
jgi:hypothetical protein